MIRNPRACRFSRAARGKIQIAVMGGSFNPAHTGHLDVAVYALGKLRVSEVWWMVSPQNPLKTKDGMAPFAERMASAERMARHHSRIRVTDIEALLGTHFTADTLVSIVNVRDARFIWIMGEDNLACFITGLNGNTFLTVSSLQFSTGRLIL